MKKIILKLPIIMLGFIFIFAFSNLAAYAEEFDCKENKHNFIISNEIPATEDSNGQINYECAICGISYIVNTYATGHKWSDWKIEKEPTCTKSGSKIRTCNIGFTHYETEEIPPAKHKYVETVVQPTCTDEGLKTFKCSVCNDSYTEHFGKPAGHSYIETITAKPTCETSGVKTFSCEHCEESYSEAIPALKHNYSNWIVTKPADEGIEGSQYKQCNYCSDKIVETIAALPITEKGFTFGVTEAVVTGLNISALYVMYLILFGEFFILGWKKQKIKTILANQKDNEDDGYEYL